MPDTRLAESKRLFEGFVNRLLASWAPPGQEPPQYRLPEDDEQAARAMARTLYAISQFMYARSSRAVGDSKAGPPYFSEYHRFWEDNSETILGLEVDEGQCRRVAERLEHYYKPYSLLRITDTRGIKKGLIPNVRLFVTIQDFGVGFRDNYYKLAVERPELFDPRKIASHPEYANEVARFLGVEDYQPDKRLEWTKRCAEWLVKEYDGDAYNLGPKHGFDAPAIRDALTGGETKIGISDKKADMFLRDMKELGVWKLKRFEDINVASDMNTMRIALRSGIVKTRIPLLSSYMDVFCYQYSAVDSTTQKGWRRVWEIWKTLPNNHAPDSPAVLDYFIYRMGKHCCTRSKRHCDTTRALPSPLAGAESYPINRLLADRCTGFCIFTGICDENNSNPFRKRLNPPKSISIYGRYGWTVSDSDEGGGLGLRA